jgi:TolB protein
MDPRALSAGQIARVWTVDVDTRRPRELHRDSTILLEAPNWAPAGLVLNGAGTLWLLDDRGVLSPIEIPGLPVLNNDHVLDPDGEHIYVSANDWNIYRAPLRGGTAELITGRSGIPGLMHFLHGVSPDGTELAFIGLEPEGENWWARASVFTVSADGSSYRRLTSGSAPADGSEYSPDGEWIYFNTEEFDGHAQIARMRRDGSGIEQLTVDENVNWFPHISPDGEWAAYIAFPPGTEGHPENVWVDVKLVRLPEWQNPTVVAHVFGGQGTINVNSWSPDSRAFAFVDYPTES